MPDTEAGRSYECVSRAEARENGQPWFYTGVACRRGHLDRRSTANGACYSCSNLRDKERRSENITEYREADRRSYWKNVDKKRQRSRQYHANNVDKRKLYDKERYPKEKGQRIERASEWNRNNQHRRVHLIAARRAAQHLASPAWLTKTQKDRIKDFYLLRAAYGRDFEVDHIVPIKGKNVCGLHVPWNLQVLTVIENNRKSNQLREEQS